MTQAYFPGSRLPRTPPAGPPEVLPVEGKKFTVGNREVELFTISQLATALNRKAVTIRKWEQEGVIPKATYSKPGKDKDVRGRRRMYSREQVEAMIVIAQQEKILHDLHKRISTTQFKTKVLAAFKEIAAR